MAAGQPSGTVALGLALTALAGVALCMQSGINATLGHASGCKSFAAAVSMAVALICCSLFMLVDARVISHTPPSLAGMAAAPWWAWSGGALGAYYVIVIVLFAQRLGAGSLIAVSVSAQLLTSVALDLAGAAGFPRRVFSWPRCLGAVLIIMGVVLVTQFPGELVSAREAAKAAAAAAAQREQQAPPLPPGKAPPGKAPPGGSSSDGGFASAGSDSSVDLSGSNSRRRGMLSAIELERLPRQGRASSGAQPPAA